MIYVQYPITKKEVYKAFIDGILTEIKAKNPIQEDVSMKVYHVERANIYLLAIKRDLYTYSTILDSCQNLLSLKRSAAELHCKKLFKI